MFADGVPEPESTAELSNSDLDKRVKALEAKISKYEKYLWLAAAVITIVTSVFGVTGAIGGLVINESRVQLRRLHDDVAKASDEVRKLQANITNSPELRKAAESAAQTVAQQATHDKLDPIIERVSQSEASLRRTDLYGLVAKNGCYFYLESDVRSGSEGNAPFRLGIEKDRSLRAVVGAQAIASTAVPKWRFVIPGSDNGQHCAHP